MGKRRPSLMKIAAMRLGPLQGGRAIAFMVQWHVWRQSAGDDAPESISERVCAYAEWWREGERTAWRDLARFREAFPGEQTPDRILDLVAEQADWASGVRGLGNAAPAL